MSYSEAKRCFDLKNFPTKKETQEELNNIKKLGLKYIRFDMVRLGLIEKWIEEFKKQEIKRLRVAVKTRKDPNITQTSKDWWDGYIEAKLEILG